MLVYVQTLVNIALRRLGPEHLPDSAFLLQLTLVLYVLSQLPLAWIAYGPTAASVTTIAAVILLRIGFVWVLLRLTSFRSRFRQTLTALLGIGALLSLATLPFSVWHEATLNAQPPNLVPTAVILMIMLWALAIDGHILARALSRPFAVGLVVAVAYFFIHMVVLFELRPLTGAVPVT
jgi:hypothetical protein